MAASKDRHFQRELKRYLGIIRRPGMDNKNISPEELAREVLDKCYEMFQENDTLIEVYMYYWNLW